jgi:hypothetical protein
MSPRKYKAKPRISELDEAAARQRRTQSCKAQRAYRQRKEDTIATLNLQAKRLEDTIEQLSSCFLGLNDKILQHLSNNNGMNGQQGDGTEELTEDTRDAMKAFRKTLVKSRDCEGYVSLRNPMAVEKMRKHNNRNNNGLVTPPEITSSFQNSYDISPLHQVEIVPHVAPTTFHGPVFKGTTSKTLYSYPSTPEALARRIHTSTVAAGLSLLRVMPNSSPVFHRVFAIYFSTFSEEQVRGEIVQRLTDRKDWDPYYRPLDSGWWSALQVAAFVFSSGWKFADKTSRIVLDKEGDDDLVVGVNEFLNGRFAVST